MTTENKTERGVPKSNKSAGVRAWEDIYMEKEDRQSYWRLQLTGQARAKEGVTDLDILSLASVNSADLGYN